MNKTEDQLNSTRRTYRSYSKPVNS